MARPKINVTPEILEEAEKLASQGLTKEQISTCLGWSYSTLMKKQRANKQFLQAITDGQAKGIGTISNALFETAKAGNVAAQIFYLKNRDGENWKDKQDLDINDARKHPTVQETSDRVAELIGTGTDGDSEAHVTH